MYGINLDLVINTRSLSNISTFSTREHFNKRQINIFVFIKDYSCGFVYVFLNYSELSSYPKFLLIHDPKIKNRPIGYI